MPPMIGLVGHRCTRCLTLGFGPGRVGEVGLDMTEFSFQFSFHSSCCPAVLSVLTYYPIKADSMIHIGFGVLYLLSYSKAPGKYCHLRGLILFFNIIALAIYEFVIYFWDKGRLLAEGGYFSTPNLLQLTKSADARYRVDMHFEARIFETFVT